MWHTSLASAAFTVCIHRLRWVCAISFLRSCHLSTSNPRLARRGLAAGPGCGVSPSRQRMLTSFVSAKRSQCKVQRSFNDDSNNTVVVVVVAKKAPRKNMVPLFRGPEYVYCYGSGSMRMDHDPTKLPWLERGRSRSSWRCPFSSAPSISYPPVLCGRFIMRFRLMLDKNIAEENDLGGKETEYLTSSIRASWWTRRKLRAPSS